MHRVGAEQQHLCQYCSGVILQNKSNDTLRCVNHHVCCEPNRGLLLRTMHPMAAPASPRLSAFSSCPPANERTLCREITRKHIICCGAKMWVAFCQSTAAAATHECMLDLLKLLSDSLLVLHSLQLHPMDLQPSCLALRAE